MESLVITARWLNIDSLLLFRYLQKKEPQPSQTQKQATKDIPNIRNRKQLFRLFYSTYNFLYLRSKPFQVFAYQFCKIKQIAELPNTA